MKSFEEILKESTHPNKFRIRNELISELEKASPDSEIGEIVNAVDKMLFKGEVALHKGFKRLSSITGLEHDRIVGMWLSLIKEYKY